MSQLPPTTADRPTITEVQRRQNVQLARVFGIRVGVEWSWFVGLFVIIFWLRDYFAQILPSSSQAFSVAVICTLLFFASVLAHEFGHALAARRLGLQIDGIDLWILGGFTRAQGQIETAAGEFSFAAAGPAVTAAITLLCVLAGLLFGSLRQLVDVALFQSNVHATAPLAVFSWLALINAFMLVFNLLPAFPLDGGRITQAVIWQLTGDRARGTRTCARIGQAFGWLVMACGVALVAKDYLLVGVWALLIGMFLEQAARRAAIQSHITDRARTMTVADIMDTQPLTIPGETALIDVDEQFFRRHHWPWFAVVDDAGHYLGLLRRERVEHELGSGRPALTAAEVSDDQPPWRVDASASLEALLGLEGLRLFGAVVAVDSEGMLRGVVTLQAIRRALSAPAGV